MIKKKPRLSLKNEMYSITTPDYSKINASKLIGNWSENKEKYQRIFDSANEPIYIYWDKFQHKAQNEELNIEEQWLLLRNIRDTTSIKSPVKAESGEFFKWVKLPSVDEYLHNIDMLMGGNIFPASKLPKENREMYINRGVIEEAIASSQLEGAHTTRVAAKKLIQENKKPKNKSELMIVNNYKAMIALEENFKDRKLSKEFLFELHSIITEGTLEQEKQKRFRKNSDDIIVEGQIGNERFTTHIPPDEKFVIKEIEKLIKYANDEFENKFVHPVIKAIIIHFWIGYLHPFTDGNGRIARALFYWYLIKNGYWAFSYLPISTVIKKSPTQYAKAYIYTEQDSFDLTYFLDYNIRKINQSIKDFESYSQNQMKQNKRVENLLDIKTVLNDRQKQLIYYFISDKNASTGATSYSAINSISRQTAATDLKGLEKIKLVKSVREGKYTKYYASEQLLKLV